MGIEDDFSKWQESGGDDLETFFLIGVEEGPRKVQFLFDEAEIDLTYPASYPSTSAGHFTVSTRTKNLARWVNEMNDWSKAQGGNGSLSGFLTKALALIKVHYSSAATPVLSPSSGDEDDEDSDYGEDDDLELETKDEFDRGVEILYKKKAWAKKEEELRAAAAAKKDGGLGSGSGAPGSPPPPAGAKKNKKDKKNKEVGQIFTSNAASGVLTNDLLTIMEDHRSGSIGFIADPIDDNIYHWNVKIDRLTNPDCPLGKDLASIQKNFNYSYVELDVSFTMDLYPFYPPMVKVIRPRLQGFMMGRVTSMELLKLKYWNPVQDMRHVIGQISLMLEEWARLDVDHERNNKSLHPDGAYTELEYLLMSLGLSVDEDPRANLKYPPPKPPVAPVPSAARRKSKDKGKAAGKTSASGKTYWAKGTGYGHHGDTTHWDPAAHAAAQKEKDRVIEDILIKIVAFLKSPDLPPGQTLAIEESSLIPLLETYLRNDSLLDMARHTSLYKVVFQLVEAVASHDSLTLLLDTLPHQKTSLSGLLNKLKKTASVFLKVMADGKADIAKVQGNERDGAELAQLITALHTKVDEALKKAKAEGRTLNLTIAPPPPPSSVTATTTTTTGTSSASTTDKPPVPKPPSSADGRPTSPPPPSTADAKAVAADVKGKGPATPPDGLTDEMYQEALEDLQFDLCSFKSGGKYVHHYNSKKKSDGNPDSKKVLRLAQEQSALVSALPLSLQSGVFLRVDEDSMDMMKVLITGPSDTPYENGAFQFDAYFPANYPNGPPLINLQTTGGGSVRFNPNLYNCGKVCLSLLGTWGGGQGETWDAATSTFLQVLVSIQSLILVDEPYFNEPGYERSIGTPEGDRQSRQYNEVIRVGTVQHAMLGQLRNPALGFEDVIRTHFWLKKDAIKAQLDKWVKEAEDTKAHAHAKLLKRHADDVKKELDKLKKPDL